MKKMKTGAKTYTGDGMSPSKMPAAKGKGLHKVHTLHPLLNQLQTNSPISQICQSPILFQSQNQSQLQNLLQ